MIDKYETAYETPVEATRGILWEAMKEESRTEGAYLRAEKRYRNQPIVLSQFSQQRQEAFEVKAAWTKAHDCVAGFNENVDPVRTWGELRDGSPGADAFKEAVEMKDTYDKKWRIPQTEQPSVAQHAWQSSTFLNPLKSEQPRRYGSSETSPRGQPIGPERSPSPRKR